MTTPTQSALTRHDAAVSEYLEAAMELAKYGIAPNDISRLAWLRRQNEPLALLIAEQSARQNGESE